MSDGGLGHISEIFDGDAPHAPCGCIAQAWSVAEVLRTYVEDVKGIRLTTAGETALVPISVSTQGSAMPPAAQLREVSR